MTTYILVLTVILSIASFYNRDLMARLIFNPYMIQVRRQWWRFFTCGFIHADWLHLGINMLVFWSFGQAVETYYGYVFEDKSVFYFILLYLGGIVISITPSYKKHLHNPGYNALGASGAVAAILFTAILFDPLKPIYLYGIISIPGIILGIAYLAYSYYMDKKGNDHINHDAHFWGAVFGVVFTLALKPTLFLHFIDKLTQF
ncbi:MAG: rhomboid family intramembrane serine protease [Bacteroidota bacterium]